VYGLLVRAALARMLRQTMWLGSRVGSPAPGALKFASWLVEHVPMHLIPDHRLGTTSGPAPRMSVVKSRVVALHDCRVLGRAPSPC
jgi:hypothetical protein